MGAELSRRCLVVLEDSADLVSLYLCILRDDNGSGCGSTYRHWTSARFTIYYYFFIIAFIYSVYLYVAYFLCCAFVRVHVRRGICVAIHGQHEGFRFLLPPCECQAAGLATSPLTH